MTEETGTIRDVVTIASPLIKSLVDTYVTPKLEEWKKRFTLDRKKYYVPSEEHFSAYFHRTYKRVAIANTLVFNNSQKLLKDIYQPLTIAHRNERKQSSYRITSFPDRLLANYDKFLITDSAGMGKSTLMKKIFLDAVETGKAIPLLVELRRLNRDKRLIDEIQEQLNAIEKQFDAQLLLELLAEGGFLILLDGYDEISLADREVVTTDIHNFIVKCSNCKFILTSRPESALSSFGDFEAFRIEPLKKKEAFELLRRYDRQGSMSSLLIKKLEESGMKDIDEFLINPLLVSLLFTAFQHRQTIPFKKHIFYRQVYDANFESHDLTKGDSYTHDKYSKLATDDFHRVLRHIGFSCLREEQRIEFTKDQILTLISKAKRFCVNLDFKESDFLKDILATVPLFTEDGNYYRWSHKSLQEYFAAQFIYLDAKEQQSKILRQLYNSPGIDSFMNLFDLYFDIDAKSFRSILLYDYLSEFKVHYDALFQCGLPNVSTAAIIHRKEVTFKSDQILYVVPEGAAMGSEIEEKKLDNFVDKIGGGISGFISSPNSDNRLMYFTRSEKKESFGFLLRSKIPELFNSRVERRKKKLSVNIRHSINENYKAHFLSDSLSDEFNNLENFEAVTELIEVHRIKPIRINAKFALSMLAKIEEQIQTENREDYLLEGL